MLADQIFLTEYRSITGVQIMANIIDNWVKVIFPHLILPMASPRSITRSNLLYRLIVDIVLAHCSS